ncbi:MAG: DUF1318 domain-containing protein [Deferrisomatales bacterium]
MKRVLRTAAALLPLLGACTLAQVKVDVVSERTALENQVLGTYNALDQEMLLVASVRGVDPEGQLRPPPRRSPEHRDAVEAMQALAFHADDVAAFQRLGWVGEGADGLLAPFALVREGAPEDLQEFAAGYGEPEFLAVVEAVNRAREAVMHRVIALNEGFGPGDLPRIRQVFALLNAENARPGDKVQGPGGAWEVKR